MVLTDKDLDTNTFRITLRPNTSLSWQGNLWVFASIAFLTLLVATGFALAGVYIILPFSGIELLVLFSCLYWLARRNARQEVITLSDLTVVIEKGITQPEQCWRYQRKQTEIHIHTGLIPWDSPTIFIHSADQDIELGTFLNKREKIKLINTLKEVVRHFQA